MLSRLNPCIDFIEILRTDTMILEEEHRLVFTSITNKHAGGAAYLTYSQVRNVYNLEKFSSTKIFPFM